MEAIVADTTGGSFTISLPVSPAQSSTVVIADGGDWSINNLTVGRNGSTIEGQANDLVLDIGENRIDFVYDGTTWQVYSGIGPKADIAITDDLSTNATRYIPFVGTTSGSVEAFNVASTKLFFNPSTGTLNATEFNSLSDISYKTDIISIANSADILSAINTYEFKWTETGQKSYGVMAQELETILPELINNTNGKKYVNYTPLISILIDGYKQLYARINQLENKDIK